MDRFRAKQMRGTHRKLSYKPRGKYTHWLEQFESRTSADDPSSTPRTKAPQTENRTRRYIPKATKIAAWRQAKGRCEKCRKTLIARRVVHVPVRKITFSVHIWNGYECYRCKALGRVLTVMADGNAWASYLDVYDALGRRLGEAVRMRFPFFSQDYSATMDESYYANHCESCGALQGDHYLRIWFCDNGRGDCPDLIEPIPGVVDWEPADSYVERSFLSFHIHHRNGDSSDRTLENLQILCVPCHRTRHGASTAL